LVLALAAGPSSRDALVAHLGIGLRTLYRELELLRRCGARVEFRGREGYVLLSAPDRAEARLPCPDPQLTLADLAELAGGPGPAAHRLAELRSSLLELSQRPPKPRRAHRPSP
jgi:predicted DNA-binding transcriptional regulator YafY